jgi:hypothetical protein
MDSALPFDAQALRKQFASSRTIAWFERFLQWESWPWLIKYLPLLPAWIYFSIRSRSFCFFTASNPRLTFAGFDGESKREMYSLLPPESFPESVFMLPEIPFDEVKRIVTSRFQFPIAVKPEVGRMGLLFRKLNNVDELQKYHHRIKVEYVVQPFIQLPIEVSVFYYRFPGEAKGSISGFVRKEYLEVIGDGISTIRELILAYDRVKYRIDEMLIKHKDSLDRVIPDGERFCLSYALNLSRGARLVSLSDQIDDQLLAIFDRLSHTTNFYFGRYDIKCQSIDELKHGNFVIMEFNGAGAEPHHVYGNNNSLFRALKILVQHWNILAKISSANHRAGIPYWSLGAGILEMIRIQRHIRYLKKADRDKTMPQSP